MAGQRSDVADADASGAGGFREVGRNAALNLAGSVVPMLLSIVTIPLVVRGFGLEKFGIIAISQTLLGYFTLFDFGIGRATTQFLASAPADRDGHVIANVFWGSILLSLLLGATGAVALASLAPWLTGSVLPIDPALRTETGRAFLWLALGVPLLTVGSSLNGTLEGVRRFDLLNAIHVPSDAAMKLAPLAVLQVGARVDVVIAVLVGVRFLSTAVLLHVCRRVVPGVASPRLVKTRVMLPLVRFGGWITVTNIIGPVMTYLDRFAIGAFVSMAGVAFYTVPFDLLRRLQLLPQSLARALFPVFGAAARTDVDGQVRSHYEASLKYLTILMAPIAIGAIALGADFLRVWMGVEFARNSAAVLQILAGAVFLNALSKPPYSLIQAAGRPDVTALFHLAELVLYLPLLYILMLRYGVAGVAAAWSLRVLLDAVLLRRYARRLSPGTPAAAPGEVFAIALMMLAWAASMIGASGWRVAATAALVFGFAGWSWRRSLDAFERTYVIDRVSRLFGRRAPGGVTRAL
jgi:O-antigen/teichoic acid export membrane protein